jgi:hypothetical protein
MARFLLTSLATVAAAAFTAAVIHFAAPVPLQHDVAATGYVTGLLDETLQLISHPSELPAAFRTGAHNTVTAMFPGVVPQDPSRSRTVLLNQPVAVRRGADGWKQLPRGTSVEIVANEGRFVQVRHARDLVTIPRAALQAGVMKTN